MYIVDFKCKECGQVFKIVTKNGRSESVQSVCSCPTCGEDNIDYAPDGEIEALDKELKKYI
jgi:predicted RNA-binding Zn-ribbon protein involved in translation (DUF1610 family)